jgi:uncharacterized protein involved in exopolysaccharide biosynthesis
MTIAEALKLSRSERKHLLRKAEAALDDTEGVLERALERLKSTPLSAEDLEREVEGTGHVR